MAFSSIIGQTEAKKRLGIAVLGIPGHAYVFSGPDGIGKTLIAREFAKALLCASVTQDGACDICNSCRYFDRGVHPDFRHLALESKEKNIKVERVRQSVCGDIALCPQLGRRKVYLLAGDFLNEQGQNALLKSLEEPPEYCCFILTIISPERLLPTILSRVSLIALHRYAPQEIIAILAACGLDAGDAGLFYARFSGGLAGGALDLAKNSWFSDLRQEVTGLYQDIGRQSRAGLLTEGYRFFDNNRDHAPVIIDILGSLVRDQLVFIKCREVRLLTNQDQLALLTGGLAASPGPETAGRLARAYAALLSARRALALNASFEGLVCNLLLNLRKEFNYA